MSDTKSTVNVLPGELMDDVALRTGFTMVPRWVFTMKDLSLQSRLLYIYLLVRADAKNHVWRGMDEICAVLGATERTVNGWLDELVAVGTLTVKRRGRARTNQYTITKPYQDGEAFARIPNWLFLRPALSRQARYAYCDLVRRKGEARQRYCCPSQRALANGMNTTERSVRRWLRELQDAGLLLVKQRKQELTSFYYPLPWTPPPTTRSLAAELNIVGLPEDYRAQLGLYGVYLRHDHVFVVVLTNADQAARAHAELNLKWGKTLDRLGVTLDVHVDESYASAV